jgi:hypothetical protein
MIEVENKEQKEHKVRNGSFRVTVPMLHEKVEDVVTISPRNYEQVETNTITVQMLTQNDYADGWRQVVPRAKTFVKKFVDTEGNQQIRHFSNAYRMKVNLAQLPEYLWHRMQYYNETTKTVNNGYHYYIVEATSVDDEIRELVNILKNPAQLEHKERVHELLTILKDNDVYGWVVIRAKSMYK